MSIASEISALAADKTAIASAITAKGGAVASGDGFDDFAADIATIPTGSTPTLITKSITQNGTYNASDDSADGYSSVAVNVSNGYVPPKEQHGNHMVDGVWVRPSEWPNIENLMDWDDESFDGVYLLYDNTGEYPSWLGIRVSLSANGQYKVERGHVANNVYVTDDTQTYNNNGYAYDDYSSSQYDYVVYRITPVGSNHIARICFQNIPTSTTGLSKEIESAWQPCLERAGRLDYLISDSGIGGYFTTHMEESDHLILSGKGSLISFSMSGNRLQNINMSGWNTRNWNLTSLSSFFSGCNSIEHLDLTGLDFSNQVITSLNDMFRYCYSLKSIDASNWNTSDWNVTNMSRMFSQCRSLTEVKIGNWDTSNWQVSNIQYMFEQCHSLKYLPVEAWDASNWAITGNNFQGFIFSMHALETIDLSGWDISGWSVTSLQNLFGENTSLKSFKGGTRLINTLTTGVSVPNVNYSKLVEIVNPIVFAANMNYSYCNYLSRQSALNIINALPTATATLTFAKHVLDKLSVTDIAIATAKGWTVTA